MVQLRDQRQMKNSLRAKKFSSGKPALDKRKFRFGRKISPSGKPPLARLRGFDLCVRGAPVCLHIFAAYLIIVILSCFLTTVHAEKSVLQENIKT